MHLRRRIEGWLPYQLRRELVRRRNLARRFRTEDMRTHAAGTDLVIESYWLDTGIDEGPALSVRAKGEEIWRVDLLRKRPHYHFNIIDNRTNRSTHQARVALASNDIPAMSELLRNNLAFPLSFNRRRSLRGFLVDPDHYLPAIAAAEQHLLNLAEQRR